MTSKVKDFVWRNRVYFVGFGGLSLLHWGWYVIQNNDAFVAEHERKPFPFVAIYGLLKEKLINNKEIGTNKTVEEIKR